MMDYNELKRIVDDSILNKIDEDNTYNIKLNDSVKYSLSSEAKRLRPVLMLATYEMFGGNANEILNFALALEYIHTYSLIHDDLPCMDNDDYRRGKLTNHKVFGEAEALLAGDALLTKAFYILSCEVTKALRSDEKSLAKAKVMTNIANNAYKMIEGQICDISWNENSTEDDLKYIYENKTGALFLAAITSGALLMECDEESFMKIYTFAENFGRAFQLADDILDFDQDSGPNYAIAFGKEKAIIEFKKSIDQCKEQLSSFNDNTVLLEILLKIEKSING